MGRKDEILVVFETCQRANWFIEDKILPLMPFLKKKDACTYESDTYTVRALSFSREDNLRGRRPDFIYLSDECSLKQYQTILGLVLGDHGKIKVVM